MLLCIFRDPKSKLKILSNGFFWFEFLNIHMNEKEKTCHGFKWQNVNVYPIWNVFLFNLMPFLGCCIVTTPTSKFEID